MNNGIYRTKPVTVEYVKALIGADKVIVQHCDAHGAPTAKGLIEMSHQDFQGAFEQVKRAPRKVKPSDTPGGTHRQANS